MGFNYLGSCLLLPGLSAYMVYFPYSPLCLNSVHFINCWIAFYRSLRITFVVYLFYPSKLYINNYNGLMINEKKKVTMLFSLQNKGTFNWETNTKILGLHLDASLIWSVDIKIEFWHWLRHSSLEGLYGKRKFSGYRLEGHTGYSI